MKTDLNYDLLGIICNILAEKMLNSTNLSIKIIAVRFNAVRFNAVFLALTFCI